MKKNAQRFWMVTAICGGIALVFLLLSWGGPRRLQYEPLQRLEFFTEDLRAVYGLKTPKDPRVVLIGIDRPEYGSYFSDEEIKENPTLKLLAQNFPWSRPVWANLVEKLGNAGAKVILIDLVFGGEKEGDEILKQTLDKYKNQVVIGCNIRDLASDRGNEMALDVPNASVFNSGSSVSPAFDERVGYVNIWADWDGVLRHARYRLEPAESGGLAPRGTILESLAARAMRKAGLQNLIPRGSDLVRFRYTARSGQGYPAISLGDVLAPRIWKKNFQNGEFFRDKIIVIGPTGDIFQDAHRTPFPAGFALMHGPEIHCNIIAAGLHGAFLHDSGLPINFSAIFLAGIIATALSFRVHQPLRRLAAIVVFCVLYWVLGQWLFNHANLVVPVASPLLVLTISGVFVLGYDYFVQQFERNRVRRTLERYVSKNVVKELLDNPESYLHTLNGVRRPITVLFSDLRGFTTMTESAEETQLVKQLNEYFAEMTRHVFSSSGTLDKFIGDAIMAVWGNIDVISQGPEKDAEHAVFTALAMRRSLAKLNASWKERGITPLNFGIGINHGAAIVGNLGSTEKMEMTVIGDTVNTASRLEGLTKWFHVDLLVSESAARLVRDRFVLRTLGLILPKGKTKPFDVFAVLRERGAESDKKLDVWLAEWEDALKLYRARKFEQALNKFESCHQQKPDDYLSERYCRECESLLKNPPDEKWDGVFVMSEK